MDEEEHSPSEFYYPEEETDTNATFRYDHEEATSEATGKPNSQEQIDQFIKGQKARNTMKKTRSDLNVFQRYLEIINERDIEISALPLQRLERLLCKFFMNVKKQDGSDYEPSTLSSYQRSIQRHLEENKYPGNILKDKEFDQSRKVLAARRKSLVNNGKGNKPQASRALTDSEEDLLFNSGSFGDRSPEILQRTIWWLLSLHFGFRARDESRKLRWGDVELQQQQDGQEMLVWVGERGTKTRLGQEYGHQRAFQPKAYATGNEKCPVKLYKKFKSHRPSEMNKQDAPFFLAIKHKRAADDSTWYMRSALGKNQIGKFLSAAAKDAGLTQAVGAKVSNHSVRKTSISRLLDADVPENFVAQHSGHKSTESLQSYKSAGQKQQRQMSLALSRISSLNNTASSTSSDNNARLQMCQNTANNSSDNSKNSSTSTSFFSDVHSVEGCSFQIFNAPVNFNIQEKRRRVIIESDDED